MRYPSAPLAATLLCFAAIATTTAVSMSEKGLSGAGSATPLPAAAAPAAEDGVLVTMFRGRVLDSRQEVSITTIFREPSFTVLGDADLAFDSEDEIRAHVRDLFSLGEVVSQGSSRVALSGGSAMLLDEGGRHLAQIRVQGQRVGEHAVRLVVSEASGGKEVVATSVVARRGKTIVLAGPAAPGRDGAEEISLLCLTPL